MTQRNYALVRVENRKYDQTYSEPIIVADSLEELQMKLGQKVGGPDDFGNGFSEMDFGIDDNGGMF